MLSPDVYDGQVLGKFRSGDNIKVEVNPMGVRLLRFNMVGMVENTTVVDDSEACQVINPGKTGWKGIIKK